MKIRKILGLVVVASMICTLALSASATPVKTFTFAASDNGYQRAHVIGNSAPNEGRICPNIVKGIRFDFTTAYDCTPVAGGLPCTGACVGIAVGSEQDDWDQVDFCIIKDGKTRTYNFTIPITWVQVAGAYWVEGASGSVAVSVLGANGVLAPGSGCDEEGCTNATGCGSTGGGNTQTNAPGVTNAPGATGATNAPGAGGGTKALNTGVGGVMALGGVAVLAVGAVLISRKRK